MIKILLDPAMSKKFDFIIKDKVDAIKEFQSAQSTQRISEAAFTILGTHFIKDISMAAKTNRAKFESLYEWTNSGVNIAKLFTVARGDSGKNMTIFLTPFNKPDSQIANPNKSSSPLAPKINISGKITFPVANTQLANSQNQNGQNLVTVPNNVVVQQAQDSPMLTLAAFGEAWFSGKSQSVMNRSGFFEHLARELPVALSESNARMAIRRKIAEISRIYSQGRATL